MYSVILDSRLDFEIKEGYAIIFEFAKEDIIKTWPKLQVPPTVESKVTSMQTEKIRTAVLLVPRLWLTLLIAASISSCSYTTSKG